ncbi:MAG TPA: hypothetical protein VMD58_03440 [Acidobacteriaceae bacterium]|nr:hypothetical protein [Acidobacteriaceae bacterium]
MREILRGAAAKFGAATSWGLIAALAFLTGCALVAAPQPPSLKLPQPVTDLTAQRVGDTVELHWTMPKRATDKVMLEGPQKVKVCRFAGGGPCAVAANLRLAPESEAKFTDLLPGALLAGPLRALTYTVELENQAGRTAGPSNVVVTAAGTAPPQIEDLHARVQPNGVALMWVPEGGQETVRIERRLAERPAVKKTTGTAAGMTAVPEEQTLEFTGKDVGQVLDGDAALDHSYAYVLQRIARLTLNGKQVEVASLPSASVRVDAKDVFPPAVPKGLQAVADTAEHAIDLSWQPDTDADLAGYTVYRREAGSSAAPERISPVAEPAPTFQDTKVMPGKKYAYSVSAIDHDGNESARSAEIVELLPQQQQ